MLTKSFVDWLKKDCELLLERRILQKSFLAAAETSAHFLPQVKKLFNVHDSWDSFIIKTGEFRQKVTSLHACGLNVILLVITSFLDRKSVV